MTDDSHNSALGGLADIAGGAGVPSRADVMARREWKARLKAYPQGITLKFEDLRIITDGLTTSIYGNFDAENGGLRCIDYDVPIDRVWFTVHPHGIPSKCECDSEYTLPGSKASYCIGRKKSTS